MSRFRYALDPACLVASTLYLLNRLIAKPLLASPFLHSHFNDLLLIPAALPPVLGLQRLLGLRPDDGWPRPAEILLHLGVWSILFEGIGPCLLTASATSDPLDLIAYAVGAAAACLYWRRASPTQPLSGWRH